MNQPEVKVMNKLLNEEISRLNLENSRLKSEIESNEKEITDLRSIVQLLANINKN